uniref:Reverse transcriptase domain-containing protein n=1 Tax=Tanacetum cinerariifolium TaxID=118510 RepID=A0A6L2NYL1_TANCI|nr:hypothetical protein [Tanacetum cinerariifolium]
MEKREKVKVNPKSQPVKDEAEFEEILNGPTRTHLMGRNRPALYNYNDDDDEDYTIATTPVLSTEEPVDSFIMEDEHLDTILETESNKVIKSSVEDLVLIPSESKSIPDNMCDAPFHDNSLPLDISKDQFEDLSDSNDDSTSIDDDYFSIDDIDYVEASPLDYELVSLEEVKDDILHEKLLNIHLLIAKIESLNDNPTPDHVLKSPSPFPIPVEDSDSFFEKFDTSLCYLDNSLPKFETFSDHTEETSSGSTTTHADNSLLEYDSFLFEIEPDQGDLTSVVMEDNLGETRVHVPNVLPTHPTLMLDSDFIPSDDSLGSDLEIDSLLEEFFDELAHIDLIQSRINEADFNPEEEIRLAEKLLYDNSFPRLLKEPNSDNYNAIIKSFFPSPIPVEGSDSLMEEIDIFLAPDDSIPLGIENDDYDTKGDIIFLEELLSNYSPSCPTNESFHFDNLSSPRPPAKLPDDDEIYFDDEPVTGVLTVKVVGDISEHYVLLPRLLPTQPTLALNEEKSPNLLSYRGFKAFHLSSESLIMIYVGDIPILDVPFLHFYPL